MAKAATKQEAKTEAPAPAAKESKPRTHPQGDKVITMLYAFNPKRKGSASQKRFDNYEEGMTVAEAMAAGVTAGDIAWDVSHGFIELGDKVNKSVKKITEPPKKEKPEAEDGEVKVTKGKGKAAPEPEPEPEDDEPEEAPAPAPRRRR